MDFSTIIEFLQRFETSRVIDYLRSLDLNTMLHNPWLLGGVGLLAVAAVVLRWRLLLITLFTVSGLAGLVVYALEQEEAAGGIGTEPIVTFVGLGAVIVLLAIYFLFIRGD